MTSNFIVLSLKNTSKFWMAIMMSLNTLFSMKGRIGRMSFWIAHLVQLIFLGMLLAAGIFFEKGPNENSVISGVLLVVTIGLFFWTGLCINGKRWHDRDKSAWWILISLIPGIGVLWVIIENGFLRGTNGPNSFGDVPSDIR